MSALLLYISHDGQTKTIMHTIANTLQKNNIAHKICNLHELSDINLTAYSSILIGAPIRYGHFHHKLKKFIDAHQSYLNSIPSAFFSVTLTARKLEKRSPQTNLYTKKFLQNIPWHPTLTAVFAGALRYPQYRWYDRLMIQFIMKKTGGETDTTKDIEYTDWQQVNQFAEHFLMLTKN
ncbi:menaquinone-dependent protoporphyrinogen IX dehydrogenase [Neisseria sp. Ec49-e6-T10]|uniref:menaquinone-dependent protoporphyrinogen IX dehydrogenase n=1 Tax=Neisseria sp. Ec49-e6-T10 TaxID=3140744 RepID=UPI003EBF7706